MRIGIDPAIRRGESADEYDNFFPKINLCRLSYAHCH
jgi:hypothetical protein